MFVCQSRNKSAIELRRTSDRSHLVALSLLSTNTSLAIVDRVLLTKHSTLGLSLIIDIALATICASGLAILEVRLSSDIVAVATTLLEVTSVGVATLALVVLPIILVAVLVALAVAVATVVLAAQATLSDAVLLAADLLWLWKARGLAGRADAEDWRLPLVALLGELLVLGGLGGDTTWKLDGWEEGLLLGWCDVDLLVSSDLLSLALLLGKLLLGGRSVARVNILGLGWVVLDLLLGLVCLLLDAVGHAVKLLELFADDLLESLLESWADNLEKEWLEDTEQHLVVGLLKLDVEVLDVNIDLVNLEEVLAILFGGRGHLDLKVQATTVEEDVGNADISDGRESLLLFDVVRNVTQVALNARDSDATRVLLLVRDALAAPAHVVVGGKLDGVWHEVVGLDDQVLNNAVHHLVLILNAWNWNVSGVLEDSRKDNLANILKKVWLEGWLSVLVVTKVVEHLLARVAELSVQLILVELVVEELELINNAISVVAVTIAKEELAVVVNVVPLIGGSILEDVALLLQALADVSVGLLEPILELWVAIGVPVELVDGSKEVIKGGVVGEALNQRLEIALGLLEVAVRLADTLDGVRGLIGEVAAVSSVVFSKIQQSGDGLVVILVSLDLNNHLLQSPDGLLTTLLWHVRVEEVFGLQLASLLDITSVVLGLWVNVLIGTVAKSVNPLLGPTSCIDTRLSGAASLILSSESGSVLWIVSATRVGLLGSIAGCIMEILSVSWCVLVDGFFELLLELVPVWSIVPSVIIGRSVHVATLLLRWCDLVGALACGIGSHLTEENGGITH